MAKRATSLKKKGASFTYKTRYLTVLRWCPVLKVGFVFSLFISLMSAIGFYYSFDLKNLGAFEAPMMTFYAPRTLNANMSHPLFIYGFATLFSFSFLDIVGRIWRQMRGKALIFGSHSVWVRGLNGLRPVSWRHLRLERLNKKDTIAIKLSYRGRSVILREGDFYLKDLTYFSDAIDWVRPDIAERVKYRKLKKNDSYLKA